MPKMFYKKDLDLFWQWNKIYRCRVWLRRRQVSWSRRGMLCVGKTKSV